jgi:hypothetical protein
MCFGEDVSISGAGFIIAILTFKSFKKYRVPLCKCGISKQQQR